MEEEPTYDSSYDTIFGSVYRNASGSKPAIEHMRVKATLEAINSVIDDQGGKRIPTAYFGILLTSLTDGRMKDEDARIASFALLSLVMPHVPIAVLKSRQHEIINHLVKLFNDNQKTESKSLMKSIITCITKMITIQDVATVTKAEITQLFQLLVTLTVDSRPKVRHAANEAIQEILVTCVEGARNSLSNTLASFVVAAVQKKTKDNQDLLHVLGLLKSNIYLLSPNGVSTIFEALYTLVVSSTNNYIPALVMQCLESLFTPPDCDEQTVEEILSKFPPSFYVQLVNALYDIQPPSLTEAAPTTSFTQLLTKAILRLNKVDSTAGAKELPKYVKLMMHNFTSDKPEVKNAIFQNLREVIIQCITEPMVKEAYTAAKKGEQRSSKTPLEQLIEISEVGLKYTYKESWSVIFEIYAIMFQTLGNYSYPLLNNILASLGELHDSDFHSAQFSQSLKSAIGTAITAMGPERFLSVLPLNLNDGLNLQSSRDWLLVMMKQYIKDAPIQYFNDYFLQLANQLMQKANKVFAEGKHVEAKNLQILYYQIWDLFPCFSDYPPDLAQGFKSVAKTLGTSLSNDAKLRKVICSGLSKMIEKSRVIANTNEGKTNVAALALFSKNFLPIFFNIYAPSAAEDRPSILAATESYVSITEQGVSNTFFKSIVQKLLEATTKKEGEMQVENEGKATSEQTLSLIELTIPFIKYLSQDNVKFLYKVVKPLAQEGGDAHLQKKAFKVMKKIVESHPKWTSQNLKDLEAFLIETVACPAPVKKVRLACIKQVVMQLNVKEYQKFIPSVLGDIILGTKDSGSKSRDTAEDTLRIIGNTLAQNDNAKEFFVMLVAGLAGQTTLMISSTLIILGKMLKEFASYIDDTLMGDLLKPVIYFVNSHNREVVRGVLDFVRSCLVAVSKEVFEPHLKDLLTGIAGLPNDMKHAYRVPVSFIFERLIKKFGYEAIAPHLPTDDHKLLNYVRKALRRRERKKQNKRNENATKRNKNEDDVLESSDDEDENEEERQKMLDADDDTQIVEHGDEPLDFMDPKSVRQMLSSRPKLKGKRTLKEDKFQMRNGKLLLPDISGNEEVEAPSMMDEDMMDTGASAKSKRKGRGRDDFEDSDEEESKNNKVQKKNQNSSQKHRKQQQQQKEKHTGTEFRSKKAKGDMLKPGQHEPYAYIPLNPKMANKRRQQKAVGQFKNIVSAAQKGAQKSHRGGNKRQ